VTPLYPQKLALTSPTGGGRSVGMVRSRTKATAFISFLTSSSQRVFGLPIGLFEMGFQECIAMTILVSCILSTWPYHPNLCALMKFIMFLCFIILSSSWLVSIRQMPFSLVGSNIFLKTVYPTKLGYFQLVMRLHCLKNLLEGLSR
jgi:hypothetical protein